jgi:hypothetical protein
LIACFISTSFANPRMDAIAHLRPLRKLITH